MEFGKKETLVVVTELPETLERNDKTMGDIDNLFGGVMDAMQDAGIVRNDKQVDVISAQIEWKPNEL